MLLAYKGDQPSRYIACNDNAVISAQDQGALQALWWHQQLSFAGWQAQWEGAGCQVPGGELYQRLWLCDSLEDAGATMMELDLHASRR